MRPAARDWFCFTAMSVGMFAAILDIQIVASALPRIAQSLNTPEDRLSWIQTTYLIAEVIAIALSGRFARALSTRCLFAFAMAGFAATSLGCAAAHDFATLVCWRTLQGFCGGIIIPTVFSAGYKMFAREWQSRALLIAGSMAMLAPGIGPLVGGFIVAKSSWHWLFLINIPFGIIIAAIAARFIDIDRAEPKTLKTIDAVALVALAGGLALLELTLKLAPADRWAQLRDALLVAGTLLCAAVFIRRSIHTNDPLVDFGALRSPRFAAASLFNFALGLGLYGSVYVLPLFLGFVRYHTPLEIGEVMTVTGATQVLAAPLASLAERKLSPLVVTAIGFTLFACGEFANAFETPRSEFADLIVPQVLRGASILFCILPITNAALDDQPHDRLANASAVLNLFRNIGGAVGIGLVDTIVNVRPAAIAQHLTQQLLAGSQTAATFIGIPAGLAGGSPADLDPDDLRFLSPIVGRAAATVAFNEAWIVLGALLLLSLAALPLMRRPRAA